MNIVCEYEKMSFFCKKYSEAEKELRRENGINKEPVIRLEKCEVPPVKGKYRSSRFQVL
jgi:hypothetical protein